MVAINPAVPSFTGGTVGDLLKGRIDIQSYPVGSDIQENFWPYAQGPLTRRPGLRFVGEVKDSTRKAWLFPFVYSIDQNYLCVANGGVFRFYVDDALLTMPGVSSTITNGTFSSMTSWTDSSTLPASASVVAGRLVLDSNGGAAAVAQQTVTINPVGTLHVIRFEVFHGPVNVRIGTTSGASDILDQQNLATGTHQLEFTPGVSSVFLQFWHTSNAGRYVDNVSFLTGSTYELALPYTDLELPRVQWEQIGDVLYLTHPSYTTRRLERRGHRSWSLTQFLPNDGPFGTINTTATTLTGSATAGDITLTASQALFTSADQGVLFKISGSGQVATATAAAAGVQTSGIKVTGVGESSRQFRIDITGTFVATVTLQRSVTNENNYTDWQTYNAPQSVNINDAQDNQTWYYRLTVKAGNYTSGSATMTLTYSGGSSAGIARVITVDSATTATCEVLDPLPNTGATTVWRRGSWNGNAGYPACVTQGYGRLWFARGLDLWSSVSDDFGSFDDSTVDDDKSVAATIAAGTSDGIRALSFLDHLVMLTQVEEMVGVPNTDSEPVSPTNFKPIWSANEGAKSTMPVRLQGSTLYVHRSGRRLMQFTQNPKALSDRQYISVDLNRLDTEITEDGIVCISTQAEPERRIFCVLENGKVQTLLFRREEEITSWSEISTRGRFEEVEVLPRNDQDRTYFIVRRKIGATWKRFIERLAPEVVLNDEDYAYLDSHLTLDLTRPLTSIEASGNSGTITITADDSVFLAGDVGKTIWLAGGRATIASFVSGTVITATTFEDLVTDEDGVIPAIPRGRWGFGTEVTSVSGLLHLEGQTVRIWADGADAGTAVVQGEAVTLPWPASQVVVGLPFTSRWRSLKLSYGAQRGTALTQPKVPKTIGYVFHRTGETVLKGPSFEARKMKPIIVRRGNRDAYSSGVKLFTGEIIEAIDAEISTDPRTCIKISGPAPCTVVAYVPHIEEIDRA